MSEPEIAVVGTKGQIVIPQRLRTKLNIKPNHRIAIYRRGDKLILTKLDVPSLDDKLSAIFAQVDEQYRGKKRPTEKEILKEIQAFRREVRTAKVR
ncbi:MAG: AbrB/MazE/SpoVT family DNA-binding domain-containing protein [Thaumarchaeota archaeon]|nr:AbrB/MazE/SpoVT family DNA-binding domain-containing protein [Nitrososphaerota archaeon]